MQEVRELPLGQHHALDEVLIRQAEKPFHGTGDAIQVLGHAGRLVVLLRQTIRVEDPFQARRALADLAADPAQFARDDVALPIDLEHELYRGPGDGGRQGEGDHALAPPAGHRPVQRERHRVDHR